jgi:hypothetical protein
MAKAHDFDDPETPQRGGDLFLWTIAILLLIGVAIACWIGSFYIFGHPEKPFSYSILTKLKKLEAPKRFEITAAPRGEFLNADQLYARYSGLTPRELLRTNETLLRDYVRNYKLTQDVVPYVVGTFNILDSYELTGKNMFTSGVVALAQSSTNQGVLIEQVFCAPNEVVNTLQRMLLTGLDIRMDRSTDLSAVVNVKRLDDGRLLFTTIPILYASYATPTGSGTLSLEPPDSLNAAAGLPVLSTDTIAAADDKFAGFRRKTGVAGNDKRPPQTQLMRVEKPLLDTPAPTPAPPPEPVAAATPPPPVATPTPQVAQNTPPTPTPTPQPATPTPTPLSIAATTAGNWPVYSPGRMPRGRLLNIGDMPDLASQGVKGERIYLQGNFVVSASDGRGAVLRSSGGLADSLGISGRAGKVKIIVQYPSGDRAPSSGQTFSRDSRRPFLITNVSKDSSGEVKVYVREVTRQQ